MARAYTSMPNVVVGFVSKERSKSSGAMYAGVPTTFLLLLLLCSFGSLVPLVFCKNAMDCCVVTMPVICATRAHPTSHIFAPDPFNNTLCDFKSPCVIFNSCKYAHPAATSEATRRNSNRVSRRFFLFSRSFSCKTWNRLFDMSSMTTQS